MSKKPEPARRNSKKKKEEAEKMARMLEELKELNAKRQAEHLAAWEAKLKKQKALEACKRCCNPGVYFSPPEGETNLWLQIQHDKNAQTAVLTFKDVKFKDCPPPPLADLTLDDLAGRDDSKDKGKGKAKKGVIKADSDAGDTGSQDSFKCPTCKDIKCPPLDLN